MAYFEIAKDVLLQLSDEQLEELIARLAEAEVAANGASISDVRWAGAITAPDGGVDVQVRVSDSGFVTGFIPRSDTAFQAKKHSMPARQITREMHQEGALSESIIRQARNSGAYIIVSLADDCSPPMYQDRLHAMRQALNDNPDKALIHLDFYDRSKLHQWLRQHPSVVLWLREKVGQPLSGWQPYARWSNTPMSEDDSLIMAPGVSVTVPREENDRLPVQEAISAFRRLFRETEKSIRVTGLSGVGKTRFVQALFEELGDEEPLDRTLALYVDTGADPIPSARAMVERLIGENRSAIVVLDNCPSSLHSALASRISGAAANLKLITVEYDIREDEPQTTEVVQIRTDGPDTAEQLLLRRFPDIGNANAHRIAEFADGNARLSLALAERIEDAESLATLRAAELFDRLFQQRNDLDGRLRLHAEALSLVYSFSVETDQNGVSELVALAELIDASARDLFRSTQILLGRQVAQRRGRWRAILPQAVANRLASDALNTIPTNELRALFERTENRRLLKSFAHRLGLMHDHQVAQEVARAWLRRNGILSDLTQLDDDGIQILEYVAPVAPDAVLDLIEAVVSARDFRGMKTFLDRRSTTIIGLLFSLAYEPEMFDRCHSILLRIADFEDSKRPNEEVQRRITTLFQPYLSGTLASPEQREAAVRDALWSAEPKRGILGFTMLSTALAGPPWMGIGLNDFGARPRDFGYFPDSEELVEWYDRFTRIVVEAGLDCNHEISDRARLLLAQSFRTLWAHPPLRRLLTEAAHKLNDAKAWTDGWKAVRAAIYYDYRDTERDTEQASVLSELSELRKLLAPADLQSRISAFVLGNNNDPWILDDDFGKEHDGRYRESEKRLAKVAESLGEEFASLGFNVDTLGNEIFSHQWMPYRGAFGRGLAKGCANLLDGWNELVRIFQDFHAESFNFSILAGFLEQAEQVDRSLSRSILDEASKNTKLLPILVQLHPVHSFDELDLERCVQVLHLPEAGARMYGDLLWCDCYRELPQERITALAEILLSKEDGDDVLLDALMMRLHGVDRTIDSLGVGLRQIGLQAAIKRLTRNSSDPKDTADHSMSEVLDSCISFPGNEAEKDRWLDTIFSVVDQNYGDIHQFTNSVRVTARVLLERFLDRLFDAEDKTKRVRIHFLRGGAFRRSRPLLGVSPDRLIAWCAAQNDPGIWAAIGAAIGCLTKTEDNQGSELSELGTCFLEACPNPEEVLEGYAQSVRPSSWSGSLSDIMRKRAAAFEPLVGHQNLAISKAAKRTLDRVQGWITEERESERREDEDREQTFE